MAIIVSTMLAHAWLIQLLLHIMLS